MTILSTQSYKFSMRTFKEFWPYYLSQHANYINRRIHFVGTLLVHLILLMVIIKGEWIALWAMPLIGYGFAWFGHYFFEKNKPATFKHPALSLIGDFKMFYMMCAGELWK